MRLSTSGSNPKTGAFDRLRDEGGGEEGLGLRFGDGEFQDEVYGQMEGLGNPSLSKEEKKAKVLQLADSSTPDFSVLESPPEESLLVSVKTMAVFKELEAMREENSSAAAKDAFVLNIDNALLSDNPASRAMADWLRLMRKLAVGSWECVTPEAKKLKWNAGSDEIYNAIIKTGLCVTNQSKTGNLNGIAKYNYGLTNSLLQMVDVQAMTEGIEIAQEALKEGFKRSGSCLAKQLFLVLINEEDARERYVAQYRDCLSGGYDVGAGLQGAVQYLEGNYTEPYFLGQATGFALTIALPSKLGMGLGLLIQSKYWRRWLSERRRGFRWRVERWRRRRRR